MSLNHFSSEQAPGGFFNPRFNSLTVDNELNIGNLAINSQIANSAIILDENKEIKSIPLLNGQLLIGSLDNEPVAANISGTPGQIVVTNMPGSIQLSLSSTGSDVKTSLSLTNTSDQISLGTGKIITLNAPTPLDNRIYTFSDIGTNANFVMDEADQTINGDKTLTGNTLITNLTSTSSTCSTLNVLNTSSFGNTISCGDINSTGSFTNSSITTTTLNATNINFTGTFSSLSVSGTSSFGNTLSCKSIVSTSSSTLAALTTTSINNSGTLSTGSVTSAGINNGTYTLITGAISSSSTFNNGTNTLTTGAVTCAAITAGGNINNGTQSLTTGPITSSGNFSNGSNTLTTGAITSSGNFSNGTNTLTSGLISGSSINISGTSSLTGSITSSGTLTCSNVITSNGSLGSPALQIGNDSSGLFRIGSDVYLGLQGNENIVFLSGVGIQPGNTGYNLGTSGSPWGTLYSNNINVTTSSLGNVSCSSINNSGTSTLSGAVSCGAITSTGNFTNGTNTVTTNSLICGSITNNGSMTVNANPFQIISNNGSSTTGFNTLWLNVTSPVAGNLYGIGVYKTGTDVLMMGVNKNTTTGQLPGNTCYISSYNTSSTLSIGRGSNTGVPNYSDIYIDGSGNVSCTNGTLTTTSISNSGTSTLTGAVSCGPITSSGNFSNGTNTLTSGAITSSGNFSNGTNTLTSGAITSSGNFSNGTNTATCGSISATKQPAALFYNNGTQSITDSTSTSVTVWNTTAQTTQGTAITCNGTSFTIPITGWYQVTMMISFSGNTNGYRDTYISRSTDSVRYGDMFTQANSLGNRQSCSSPIFFNASETFKMIAQQGSGSTLTLGGIDNNGDLGYVSVYKLP